MLERDKEKDRKDLALAGIVVLSAIVLYGFFRYIFALLLPFVIGILLALVLKKPVNFLKKKIHVPVVLGTVLMLILLSTAVIAFIAVVGKRFVNEAYWFVIRFARNQQHLENQLCEWCSRMDRMLYLQDGNTFAFVENSIHSSVGSLGNQLLPSLVKNTAGMVSNLVLWGGGIIITFTTLFFLMHDMDSIVEWLKKERESVWYQVFFEQLTDFGRAFLKTQFILMAITTVLCTLAMYLVGNAYPIMMGTLIGILDALPLFGTGTILIPWTILCIFQKKIMAGAILFSTYCVCYIVREFLEPKMMGQHMGIHPVIMLGSIYLGLLVFGLLGFVIGPVYYIWLRSIGKYVKNNYLYLKKTFK